MEHAATNNYDIQIDSDSRGYLLETAKWSKFFAILGFIFCGLMIFGSLAFLSMGSFIFDQIPSEETAPAPKWLYRFLGIVYIIMSGTGFYVSLLLYRFGEQMTASLNENGQEQFTSSLKNLRMVFRIYGIFMIIYLTFATLAIIIIPIAAIMAG